MIAALYVETGGAYYGLEDVDPWDEARDARTYDGPWPVVAHPPPCARWSRLAGFTEHQFGLKRGEDGGCFAAALDAVERWGGVIEHPAYSDAWARFNLPRPSRYGGWMGNLFRPGLSCYVEQGRYGLPVKKATWLYAVTSGPLPELRWGWTPDGDGTLGGDSSNWAAAISGWEQPQKGSRPRALSGAGRVNRHNGKRSATPPAFRDELLAIARSASPTEAQELVA